MAAYLIGVRGFVPYKFVTNDDLVRANPTWNSDKIFAKTGIRSRHVVGDDETSADLGFRAADALLTSLSFDRSQVDAILFCTQTPDYLLPPSACLLQTRLDLPTSCAAFDFNLGCSGFVYGLWLAKSLVESQSARNVLIVVGETYSKLCNPHDMVTVTLFGDGGGAALVSASAEGAIARLGLTVLGTDGRGAEHLIVRAGAARNPHTEVTSLATADDKGNLRSDEQLFMNGPEVFSFTLARVSSGIQELLDRVQLTWDDVDLFLFHQANAFMLEQLRNKMKIPVRKMPVCLEETGNTVSATIPLLIQSCQAQGLIQPGFRCVLAGFGVGYSWAFSLIEWQ
jgi:3-oxoacyl-[acyl-carrier-protein] synthase-3